MNGPISERDSLLHRGREGACNTELQRVSHASPPGVGSVAKSPPESLHYDSSHKSLLARQTLPEFLVESGQVCGEVRVPSQLEQPGHSILNTAGRNP